MKKHTKWATAITVVIVLLTIAAFTLMGLSGDDIPEHIREFTKAVLQTAICSIAAVWIAWRLWERHLRKPK